MDTCIEDTPEGYYPDRPWGKGNNPKTAVWEYLKGNSDFEIDREIEDRLLITAAPDGFLKRVQESSYEVDKELSIKANETIQKYFFGETVG